MAQATMEQMASATPARATAAAEAEVLRAYRARLLTEVAELDRQLEALTRT